MQDIRRRIISGALPAGECLPSVRRYAAQMQVSPSTVMEAYERLAATGIIVPRRGAGFFVTGSHQAPLNLVEKSGLSARCRSLLGVPPVAGCRSGGAEARLWLASRRLDAGRGTA